MSDNWAEDIGLQVGCTQEQVRRVVTAALRLLHEAGYFDQSCNRDILDCRFQFGEEACFHLGGIILNWEDDEDPMIVEILQRFLGYELKAINAKWVEETKDREVRYR